MFIQLTRDYLGRKAGERLDVSDDDARQLIAQGLAQAVTGDVLGETVQRAVADTMARLNGTLQQSVETALKQFTDAQTRSRKNAVPILFGESGSGDPKRTFGQFLLAVRHGDRKSLEAMGSQYAEWEGKAALTTQVGTQGGYTVPEEFLPRLLALATENAVVRPRATIIPMTSRTVQVPCLDATTVQSAGDSAFLGGLVARWTEEASSLTETEPTFRQVELVAHELSGYA
jgi:HK97 family phage major capsid protein